MDSESRPEAWQELLQQVAVGTVSPQAALAALQWQHPSESTPFPVEPLGVEPLSNAEGQVFARLDHERAQRQGFPEVIYCEGKTPLQVAAIAARLQAAGAPLLATRARSEHFAAVRKVVPEARWHETARTVTAPGRQSLHLSGMAGVVCAGTSDLPVAEEARVVLEAMGATTRAFYDCGVAGLHRLLEVLPQVRECDTLICVAGMEGALPSVLAGLVSVPVIAVPTSVGYGTGLGGVAALLSMLNACASGIAVVNIDNGFGAAAFAASILRQYGRERAGVKSTCSVE